MSTDPITIVRPDVKPRLLEATGQLENTTRLNYVKKDIPVTYFSLGYAQDYHMQTDEPQYIDYDHSARLGRFVHDVMMAISERKTRPAIAGPDPSYPTCR